MNTAIIPTEGVVGNIGQCVLNATSIETGRTLFVTSIQNSTVNSCTGEVTNYSTWALTGTSILTMLCVAVIAIVVLAWVLDID